MMHQNQIFFNAHMLDLNNVITIINKQLNKLHVNFSHIEKKINHCKFISLFRCFIIHLKL